MSYIAKFFDWLNAGIASAEQERREAYLAQSTDHYDLERRMREIERKSIEYHGW
jgi:hypothetical protein